MRTRVFVYGTLRKTGRLHGNLKDAEFMGNALLPGYEMFDVGAFPAVVMIQDRERRRNAKPVYGELYEIDAETRERLDFVEGFRPEDRHNSLYIRNMVEAQLESNPKDKYGERYVTCEVYVWNGPTEDLTPIPDGDYMKYLRKEV